MCTCSVAAHYAFSILKGKTKQFPLRLHWIFEYKDVQIRLFRIHLGLIHQVSRMAMLIKPLTALPKSAEFETIKLRGYFMKPIKIRNPNQPFFTTVSFHRKQANQDLPRRNPDIGKPEKRK